MITGPGTIHFVLNTGFVVGAAWNVWPPTAAVLEVVSKQEDVIRKAWRQSSQKNSRLSTEPVLHIEDMLTTVC